MSEIEWVEPPKDNLSDLLALDAMYDTSEKYAWQRFLNGFVGQSDWIDVRAKDAKPRDHILRRRKDTPNWIAEKYEAGHELTLLETVHYYILNHNSMSGLEIYLSGSAQWRAPHERDYPVPNRRYRLAKKKPMVIVNGHKVPKWETEPLRDGDTYFLVDLPSDIGYARIKWVDSVPNRSHLENGTVFKNESDIQEFVEALCDIKEVTE